MTSPHPYLARKDAAANAKTMPSRTGAAASSLHVGTIGSTHSKSNVRNGGVPASSLGGRLKAPSEIEGTRKPSTSRPSVLGIFGNNPPPATTMAAPAPTTPTAAVAVAAAPTATPAAAVATSDSPTRKRTMSTLMAPTASSLAKQGLATKKNILDPITNSPQKRQAALLTPRTPAIADKETKIFSKPLVLPSVPKVAPSSPTKQQSQSQPQSQQGERKEQEQPVNSDDKSIASVESLGPSGMRPKLSARRPRISRSKVIAKLALQRAESDHQINNGNNSSPIKPRQPLGIGATASPSRPRLAAPSPRTRSSIGANVRQSYNGKAGGDNSVLMSAKKRVRQSEYLQRRTRIPTTSNSGATAEDQMNVDD
jgi:hypothetical protein